jgi:uncharacterized protein (UPF0305 family)
MTNEMSFDALVHIKGARDSWENNNFLAARMNYLKCVEQLKKEKDFKNLETITQEYESFVKKDPYFYALAKELINQIKNSEGILQSDITKNFQSQSWPNLYHYNREISKDDVYYALYFADKFGYITRKEKGRTYELFFKQNIPEELIDQLDQEIKEKNIKNAKKTKSSILSFFLYLIWAFLFFIAGGTVGIPGCIIVIVLFVVFVIIKNIIKKKKINKNTNNGT